MKLILALSGVVLMAGCASTPTQVASTDLRPVCDQRLMQRVHAQAVATGAQVYWQSCPLAKDEQKS
jgi:uncharacterized lipoprotein YajG